MTEAIFNNQDILQVTPQLVEDLKEKALATPRKRFRLCMHHSLEDQTHEMLIVFHQASFMSPHRHPKGKSESYHVVEGAMNVYFFNDEGQVIKNIEMGEIGSGKPFLYRLSENIWHMPIPTTEWLVYHETYSGPFKKEYDVEFPSWAPQEENKKEVQRFLELLYK